MLAEESFPSFKDCKGCWPLATFVFCDSSSVVTLGWATCWTTTFGFSGELDVAVDGSSGMLSFPVWGSIQIKIILIILIILK